MGRKEYRFRTIEEEGDIIGVLGTWDFHGFSFIEHIAIRERMRNQGFGSKVMHEIISQKGRIVLETELPTSDLAQRRIRWYERLGFKRNPQAYMQPAYSPEKMPVSLCLMSAPERLTNAKFEAVRMMLHTKVYGLKEALR